MKIFKIRFILGLCLIFPLFAQAGQNSTEVDDVVDLIGKVSSKVAQEELEIQRALNQKKDNRALELDEENKKKKEDSISLNNSYISSIENMRDSIEKSYVITDVETITIGEEYCYVNENELIKVMSFLVRNKSLLNEIDSFLSVTRKSSQIKSNNILMSSLTTLKAKHSQLLKETAKASSIYFSNGKRVELQEGLISNGIYAKLEGSSRNNSLKIYFK